MVGHRNFEQVPWDGPKATARPDPMSVEVLIAVGCYRLMPGERWGCE